MHVSTRSPSPVSPASVSRFAPAAHASRDISASPRVIRPAQRVVAEPKPFDHARGDGDDVLQRAADLDADDVIGAVQPEVRRPELGLHVLDDVAASREATETAVGSSRASSAAKLGPDSTATCTSPPSSCATISDTRNSVSARVPWSR